MSSGSVRDPLCGIIMQDSKVVGSVAIPEEESDAFIEAFNNCYGPLRLQVAELNPEDPMDQRDRTTFSFRLPTWYRQAWQPPPPPMEHSATIESE